MQALTAKHLSLSLNKLGITALQVFYPCLYANELAKAAEESDTERDILEKRFTVIHTLLGFQSIFFGSHPRFSCSFRVFIIYAMSVVHV